ncbi:transporter associated domain-containing protein [Streptomyces sp. NPDC007971]
MERIPADGDTLTIDGWEITVRTVEHHRADRVTLTAPTATPLDQENTR